MTIGMDLDALEQQNLRKMVDAQVTPRLPFSAVIASMSLLILDRHGSWREEFRFPLRTGRQSC